VPDFHAIPSIEQLRTRPAVRALETRFGAAATVDALRAAADEMRQELAARVSNRASTDEVVAGLETAAAAWLDRAFQPTLVPVINATGVVIHTNLGRAPLASAAAERVAAVAQGYSTLEYDVERGGRGRRDSHAEALLCRLTGAEAAVVVNNNAAATLIVLAALAAGREVIVSRGELVEIGGGFRVPDVLAQSGATLREVGTTNRTRASDYGAAIGDRTALILRVHPSNFTIEGFTARPSLTELVSLGRAFNIPVVDDLGSGNLVPIRSMAGRDQMGIRCPSDPTVQATVAAGVDVCCFSGDKLLGGPQAGIIVGRAALVDRVRTHPLMRALRVDKMTYAALEPTLAEYLSGRSAETIPVQRMLTMTADEIGARAKSVADAIGASGALRASVISGMSTIGGGSAPGVELPTSLVALASSDRSPDALAAALRRLTPPIIARIERDIVVLDLRTVPAEFEARLIALLRSL
jgi:L-seryl-tRNA(Ser) seleniumtransferase